MKKWDKYYDHLDTIPPTSFCGSKEAWRAILEEEKRKGTKNKCDGELLTKSNETANTEAADDSKKVEDIASECSEKSDRIIKEYVMIPIKADSKTIRSR